jgi:hypothetical protein
MSDYQRLHDALEQKGFSPRPGDDGFFTTLYAAEIIRGLVKPDNSKKEKAEDKSKSQLKKQVANLQDEIKALKKKMVSTENINVDNYSVQTSNGIKRPLPRSTIVMVNKFNSGKLEEVEAEVIGDNGLSMVVRVLNEAKMMVINTSDKKHKIKISDSQITYCVAEQNNVNDIILLLEKHEFSCIKSTIIPPVSNPDHGKGLIKLNFEKKGFPLDVAKEGEKILIDARLDVSAPITFQLGYNFIDQ